MYWFILAIKVIVIFAAVFFSLLVAAMWLLWLFGRTGPEIDGEFWVNVRYTGYAAGIWLVFVLLAFL